MKRWHVTIENGEIDSVHIDNTLGGLPTQILENGSKFVILTSAFSESLARLKSIMIKRMIDRGMSVEDAAKEVEHV